MAISAEQTISSVVGQMGYRIFNLREIESSKGISKKGIFNKAGISNSDIPVRLMYYFQDGIGTTLVWELSINETDSSNWWNFRVDCKLLLIRTV